MKTLVIICAAALLLIHAAQGQAVWRPFSSDSPWNQKVPAGARTDPNSAAMIDSLTKGEFNINIDDWSIPVYYIDADTVPRVKVLNSRPGIYGRGFADVTLVPILPSFIASPPVGEESDNHMSVVDTTKKLEWGMWATRRNKEGQWTTGLGALTNLGGTGVEKPWYEQDRDLDAHRGRASGFPLIAGLIRPEEISAGKIDHALVFACQRGRSEFFVPPASTAQETFMEMSNAFGIPMGGRIQLDPAINVDTLPITPACKVIARALQEYGAFNGDYAGATVLYADNSPRALKLWKGVLKQDDFRQLFTPEFMRRHLRVIELGQLLPGQNLAGCEVGFVAFSFTGADRVSIDWLKRRITCVVASSADLEHVKPLFQTVRKNSTVFVGETIQESGRSVVDLRGETVYAVEVRGVGKASWTVIVLRE